jgi:magnesium transporter
MQKMGGVQALEDPYISTPIFSLVKKRAPWLALLFMSELLTTSALGYFEGTIAQAAVLATFIPAIISSGGNSGSQASTLVIRALALKEIELKDWFRVLRREFATALILGLMVGAIGLVRVNVFGAFGWFKEGSPEQNHFAILAVAIASTLVCVVLWGSIMGAMLPMILKKLGFDPAGSSTPFVATLVDVTGIIIYFTIAISVLKGTILTGPRDGPTAQFTSPTGERFVLFTDSAGRPTAAALASTPGVKLDLTPVAPPKPPSPASSPAPSAAPAQPAP